MLPRLGLRSAVRREALLGAKAVRKEPDGLPSHARYSDPAMHLGRRHRVLVDEGGRNGLILLLPTQLRICGGAVLAGTAGRIDCEQTLASFPEWETMAFHTLQRFTPESIMGRPKADPEENRDPGQDFCLPCA
jgi:hypothetical protein